MNAMPDAPQMLRFPFLRLVSGARAGNLKSQPGSRSLGAKSKDLRLLLFREQLKTTLPLNLPEYFS
jgi:hypothetical protein